MGVLDAGGYRRSGRGNFEVDLWRTIVTNRNLMRSCAEVREPIELSLVEVSGVGCDMDGSTCPKGKGGLGYVVPIHPAHLTICLTEMYSTRA